MIKVLEPASGARLVYEKIDYTGICSIGFWFLNGSNNENDNEKGYAHFIEHILFKGTKTKTTSEIARAFDRIGSNFNAFTEKELTCFYCTFPARHLEYILDLMSEILFHPLFESAEIQKEKSVIKSEIHEYEELPDENSYDIFLSRMWSPHPMGYKITCEAKDISKITKKRISSYYCENYTSENLIISVAGNFDEHLLLSLLDKAVPPGKKSIRSEPDDMGRPKFSFDYIHNNSRQAYIQAGIAFSSPADMQQYYNLLFFSTLIGESMSSRLFQKLREDEGLCYSIYSFRSVFSSFSMWNIYANTDPKNLDLFFEKLQTELTSISEKYFQENEIDEARTHLEGNLILSGEDMELRMKRQARHYIFSGKTFDSDESLKMIKNVGAKDINDLVKNFFKGKEFNILIYGDTNIIKPVKYRISF